MSTIGAQKDFEVFEYVLHDYVESFTSWYALLLLFFLRFSSISLHCSPIQFSFALYMHPTVIKKEGKATTIQGRSVRCLTEGQEILNWWTEYCSELCNHRTIWDLSVLNCPKRDTEDDHPTLHKEVGAESQKKGKSAAVDNIPAELVQAGGEAAFTALLKICNKIWQTGEWSTPWTKSIVISLPKKGNLHQCQNYRTISLVSHPSKVMLKVILNRLKPQAEEIIAEEGAGCRAWSSTTEQIFSLRITCEKYLQYQQDLYHTSIDFKKAFAGFGMQPCGQPWRTTTTAPTSSESLKTSMTRPLLQSSSTAA